MVYCYYFAQEKLSFGWGVKDLKASFPPLNITLIFSGLMP